ncbi:MAG: hypothetical protein J7M25_11985 [Deltaproteobacteria bacterium]|nr:hypothetical protein [Deltaproteobacteria bacterium]
MDQTRPRDGAQASCPLRNEHCTTRTSGRLRHARWEAQTGGRDRGDGSPSLRGRCRAGGLAAWVAVGLFAASSMSGLLACRHKKAPGSKSGSSRATKTAFNPHVDLITTGAVGYGFVDLEGLVKHWPQLASWLLAGPKKSLVGWIKSQYGLDLSRAHLAYVLFVQPENRHAVFSGLDLVAVVPQAAWDGHCRHETEQMAGLSACRLVQEMFVVRRSGWAYLGSRPALTLVLGKHAGPAKRDNFALWVARTMKRLQGHLLVIGLRGDALALKGMRHVLIDVGLDRRMQVVIRAELGQDDAADKLGQSLRGQVDRMARGLLEAKKVIVPGQEAVVKQASAVLSTTRIDVEGRSVRVRVKDIGPLVAYLFVPVQKPSKVVNPTEPGKSAKVGKIGKPAKVGKIGKPAKVGKTGKPAKVGKTGMPASSANQGGPSGSRTARSTARSRPH